MKKPKRVKVVANVPSHSQCSIQELIGKEFKVKAFNKENQEVTVDSEEFKGLVVLNKDEYKVIT